MPEEAAISGIDDASQVRVRLLQSGRAVHAPVLSIGLQPLDADLTSWALITRAAGFDTFVATPSSANFAALVTGETGTGALVFGTSPTIATPVLTLKQSAAPTPTAEGAIEFDTDQDRIVVGDGAGQAIFGQVTPWVAYTPTFTGFGTVSAVSIWSRRMGDSLHIRGRFTTGTPTAVEARMTLGFNGTNANVTSDTTKIVAGSPQVAGPIARSTAGATSFHTLCESNVGYITFGMQDAANGGMTKQNGNAIFGAGIVVSLMAEVPISGW